MQGVGQPQFVNYGDFRVKSCLEIVHLNDKFCKSLAGHFFSGDTDSMTSFKPLNFLVFTTFFLNFQHLGAAPKIALSKETLNLRSGESEDAEDHRNLKNRIQLFVSSALPLAQTFSPIGQLEFSNAQSQGVGLDYTYRLLQKTEIRGGVAVEFLRSTAQSVDGSGNTTVYTLSTQKIPQITGTISQNLFESKNFQFNVGNTLGFSWQKLTFETTNTSAPKQERSLLTFSNAVFLENHFLREGNLSFLLRLGWALSQLPSGVLDNTIDTVTVKRWGQGLYLSAGLGYGF